MAGTKPWPEVPIANRDHNLAAVVIIGAGMSGMCTAIDLIKRNNCRNFVILEKSSGVGGTWHDNKYPGCCCDVRSVLYSYSFEQKSDWTREYPGQEEILSYLVDTAQKYNLFQHIRFNSSVDSARWDDVEMKWKTKVVTAKGSKDAEFNPEYEITSDFLVSAVGQLNMPKLPEGILGLHDFQGKLMHSARWDWSYDLSGKRIAVIGNGATGVQAIPELAKVASQVTIYGKTPNWVIPRLDGPVSPFMRDVLKYVPPIRRKKRALVMDGNEGPFLTAVSNNDSAEAGELQRLCLENMRKALPDRPDMWEKLTPKYKLGCKRVLVTDEYYPTLAKPNVRLETRSISQMSEKGIEVRGDEEGAPKAEDFDLIVCATGFQTLEFMHPIKITGANGRALADMWKPGAQALYGVTVEGLPNFGMLYGPNTNLGHNSIIVMIEAQSRYINALVGAVLTARKQGQSLSLSPTPTRIRDWNVEIQEELAHSSFADPACQSWYKNENGLITNNWSRDCVNYQKLLSKVHWTDYKIEGSGSQTFKEKRETHIGRVVEETQISNIVLAVMGVVSVAAVAGSLLARGGRFSLPSIRV